ncbi:MAG: succinyl-diaminopimelate desuccinylase [Proteobacteria bacterium]|nr:succinyl-diaminopimelate desuccinylase [Pseudomonadota bacterium]
MNHTTDARHHPHPAVAFTAELVAKASLTPHDAGCQALLIEKLTALGFTCETLVFDDVTNLWAKKGTQAPLFAFAGHTDVVPSGDKTKWRFDPFTPTIHNEQLYGRGSADMKGGIGAFMAALESFLEKHQSHQGSIGILITSDEEGAAVNGTVKVIETLVARGEQIDYCIVGEPTAEKKLGDMIKNGRRGSLSGKLVVYGKQGHIAYPHLADNPIHRAMPILTTLSQTVWDHGNNYFPATSFQISNIKSGLGVSNVIPPDITVDFNFRFSTEHSAESLKAAVHKILDDYQANYHIDWTLSGNPWLTQPGKLVDAATFAIHTETGLTTELSTGGGISDGRFIAPTGAQVIELGPLNESIHKIDEHVGVNDLISLSRIYCHILTTLLIS